MRLEELQELNKAAQNAVVEFRERRGTHVGVIDETFHWYKNHFPFFGFVEARIRDWAFVMFSANDDLVAMTYFWHGPSSFERHSVSLWSDLATNCDVALDVGAFSGLYSLLLTTVNANAHVLAFEPSRRTHARLLLNLHANRCERRVRAKCAAVSNKTGESILYQFRGENVLGNGASLLNKDIPVVDSTERVHTLLLDEACEDEELAPDLVKIDIEGAEALALQGFERTLSRARPTCLIEVTPSTYGAVYRTLERHSYRTRVVDEQACTLLERRSNVSRVGNLLAQPRSKPA